MSQKYQVPATPRVTSPSPTASESSESRDTYFAPITRSATARRNQSQDPITEESESSDSSVEKRARTRSRSPKTAARLAHASIQSPTSSSAKKPSSSNGHLSPSSAAPSLSSYWRDLSRSPSPLGLIPIHRHWRSIIHRHEIPRKVLHVSIGFVTLHLYTRGTSPAFIHPWLLGALIPIASTDYLRHTFPGFNRFYIRVLGALMRESEVNGWNGVIWYLLGAWTVLYFFPKDVGVMGVLLLSWCDTAASTFGRLYGRYTPRIRRGKSLAGSVAAATVGALTAGFFWGWMVPRYRFDDGFMFRGTLTLPAIVREGLLGWTTESRGSVDGWIALGIVGLWSGFVASASEVVDIFGWDDNLTIPVLSGLGLWGFFKAFG